MKHTNANWKYIPSNGAYIVLDFAARTVRQRQHIPPYRKNRVVFCGVITPAIANDVIDVARWVRTDPLLPIDYSGRITEWVHQIAETVHGRWVSNA